MEINITKKPSTKIPLSTRELDVIFSIITKGEKSKGKSVSITFVTPLAIQKLNKQYRKKNKPTDILSFPDGVQGQLGDLIICPSYVSKKVKEYKHTLRQHYTLLLIHGTLHLLGYDHITDKDFAMMKKKENAYFSKVQKKLKLKDLNY